ncbi:hypothetical protein Q9290_05570 [Oceanimonas sp. CHS3-5]|uniref:hypothetical protein n=1 Tax=Oceanimonas sp. CHS3-5 TaxID=3068186 RepID=UPI00273FE50E|nr:hypothetical protein [Oceanimonas sp. CHS3-5]MDP5291756.1 hypothetical protein [Oceanimonas sp. CHS3-5]
MSENIIQKNGNIQSDTSQKNLAFIWGKGGREAMTGKHYRLVCGGFLPKNKIPIKNKNTELKTKH